MATLKISDLSVGDWVRYRGLDYQVIEIDVKFERVGFIGNKEERVESFYTINPIVISAEILERNGFVKNGQYNEWSIGNWDDIPFIGISLSRQSARIKNLGTDIFLENKVVYVHQLQRAFSLANIDKEITL